MENFLVAFARKAIIVFWVISIIFAIIIFLGIYSNSEDANHLGIVIAICIIFVSTFAAGTALVLFSIENKLSKVVEIMSEFKPKGGKDEPMREEDAQKIIDSLGV